MFVPEAVGGFKLIKSYQLFLPEKIEPGSNPWIHPILFGRGGVRFVLWILPKLLSVMEGRIIPKLCRKD
jgi:hypothetical protein